MATLDNLKFNTNVEVEGGLSVGEDITINGESLREKIEENSVGQKLTDGGEIFNDYENNQALSEFSHAEGTGTLAGGKAFSLPAWTVNSTEHEYTSADQAEDGKGWYYLGSVDGIEAARASAVASGKKLLYTAVLDSNFDLNGEVEEVDETNSRIKVSNYKLPLASGTTKIDGDSYLFLVVETTSGTKKTYQYLELGDKFIGEHAHAEGRKAKAISIDAHAEGRETLALGKYAHTEGRETVANYGSHAEGKSSQALGETAHAEGNATIADGDNSHSQGFKTKSSGINSFAYGKETVATGPDSAAGGFKSQANGQDSFAFGNYVKADKDYSVAFGRNAQALEIDSVAIGLNTKATSPTQVVVGKNNLQDDAGQFIVGISDSALENYKKNGFVVYNDGDAWIGKDIHLGGTSRDTATDEVAKVSQVTALKNDMNTADNSLSSRITKVDDDVKSLTDDVSSNYMKKPPAGTSTTKLLTTNVGDPNRQYIKYLANIGKSADSNWLKNNVAGTIAQRDSNGCILAAHPLDVGHADYNPLQLTTIKYVNDKISQVAENAGGRLIELVNPMIDTDETGPILLDIFVNDIYINRLWEHVPDGPVSPGEPTTISGVFINMSEFLSFDNGTADVEFGFTSNNKYFPNDNIKIHFIDGREIILDKDNKTCVSSPADLSEATIELAFEVRSEMIGDIVTDAVLSDYPKFVAKQAGRAETHTYDIELSNMTEYRIVKTNFTQGCVNNNVNINVICNTNVSIDTLFESNINFASEDSVLTNVTFKNSSAVNFHKTYSDDELKRINMLKIENPGVVDKELLVTLRSYD